ncbi:MAG TPA: thiol-disulfide isomerase [Actinomycetota bacterium]
MTGWWAAAFVAQWVLVIVLALVVVALARQVGTLHLRLGPRGALEVDDEGPPLGDAPLPMRARAADGAEVTIGGPGPRRLVVFSSPTCPVCREVVPAVPTAANAAGVVAQVVHDPDGEREWDVPGTPFAVVLDASGVVRAKGTVNDLEQLEGLLDTATRRIDEDGEHAWAS